MVRQACTRALRLGVWLLVIAAVALGAFVLPPRGRAVEGDAAVVDGDSLRMGGVDIRLKGIDAPELRQSCSRGGRHYRCGETAKAALSAKIAGRDLSCRIEGRDRYGRSLARCSVAGEDLGAWLVREGIAVGYRDYEAEEDQARRRGAGLWAGEFQRPSAWRQEHMRS